MNNEFAELGLNEHILAGVEALGFTTPTPVQREAIPQVLAGRDVVASAQTGTGKTAAFTLPVLQVISQIIDAERAPSDVRAPVSAASASDAGQARATGAAASDGAPDVSGDGIVTSGESPATTTASALPDDEASQEAKPSRRRRRHRRRGASPEADGSNYSAVLSAGNVSPAQGRSARKPAKREVARVSAGPLALVITPTRELASQIDKVAQTVASKTGQRVATVIGGERYDKQLKRLKDGCDLLVATPGRLIDLMERKEVRLSDVRVLVLDEADRMLDMGFWPSVRKIVANVPKQRQTLLFSATISGDIEKSMPTMLKDPVNVEIARKGQTADTVEQRLVPVVQGQKVALLSHLIEQDKPSRVLVFCRTKQRVDSVAAVLDRNGFSVGVMHADRQQRQREKALRDFRDGKLGALIATDVMSRGIDVEGIDWVVNFDVPLDPEDYVHRIGRTGRAGESGIAFTFVAPDEITPLREIEYFTKSLVPVWEPEGFEFAQGRIVPNPGRATTRSARSLFSGSRGRGRGPAGGRFGRHT